jgi:hypothetical protein
MKPAIRSGARRWPRINLGGTWRVCQLSAVAVLYVSAIGVSEAQNDTGAAAFERLSALVGDWSGSFEWSGALSGSGAMNATYYATGNGSAIVENLIVGGVPTMTSVYHLDGADLRMTHYCAARNQPRLKANKIDNAQGILDFSFVDATNLSSPDAPHVYGVERRFLDADHTILTFLYESGGKRSKERIDLKRVPARPAVNGKE